MEEDSAVKGNTREEFTVLVKPLLRFWKPWKYVTNDWDVLTEDKSKAEKFDVEVLIKVEDYYWFYRKDHECE